jgi:hypothetical protein
MLDVLLAMLGGFLEMLGSFIEMATCDLLDLLRDAYRKWMGRGPGPGSQAN